MKTFCYPNLVSNDLVSIQPMSGPVSLIFYLDYLYGSNKGGISAGAAAFDARTGPTGNETYSGDSVVGELLATGNGSTATLTGTLTRTPIRPGTVTFTAGTFTLTDDGKGDLVGTGINSGTVNYATGAVSIVFSSAPAAGVQVKAAYRYDGEAQDNVPQIDLQLTSAPVEAVVRKLRARFSLEAAQNLNALTSGAIAA
jgi:hypothetical protein